MFLDKNNIGILLTKGDSIIVGMSIQMVQYIGWIKDRYTKLHE